MHIHSDDATGLKRPGRWVEFPDLLQRWLARRWRRFVGTKRAARLLAAADDHMLKDIGISRSDIDYVVRHGRPRAGSQSRTTLSRGDHRQ
jgi:uncharacterized protein YjiS (DUF1127 family)